jgi:hypothetical protein
VARINLGKVIVGGLAAGLVANVFDFVINNYLMRADWEAVAMARNLDMAAAMNPAPWIVIDFVLGILIVWTYAAMRPRLGPGPGTAICAGGVLWLAVTLVMTGLTFGGFFPMAVHLKMTVFQAINMVAASYVGAMLYKE